MAQQKVSMDWQVLLDDREWGRTESLQDLLSALPKEESPARSPRFSPTLLRVMAGIVSLIVLVAGIGLWYFGNLGASRIEQEIQAMVNAETWSQTTNPEAARSRVDHQADPVWQQGLTKELERDKTLSGSTLAVQTEVRDITLRSGLAMAEVVVTGPDRLPYRELQFYRADPNDGWLRTAPDAGFWGPQQTTETDHFRLVFHHKDAAVVLRAALKLDTIYEQLRQDAGLSPEGEKLTVAISPVSVYQLPSLYFLDDRLVVHSPYLLQVPVSVTNETILIKSIVNPLVVRLMGEASRLEASSQQWWPVVNGLWLWEAYVGSDSLAPWYWDVVNWYYPDVSVTRQAAPSPNGTDWTPLCREHLIWRDALPTSLPYSVFCNSVYRRQHLSSAPLAPKRLDDMLNVNDWVFGIGSTEVILTSKFSESAQIVAAATLVDYVVHTYGRAKLPELLAGLRTYESWTTLSPAVFGVSAEELEAGWQRYLAEQLGPNGSR